MGPQDGLLAGESTGDYGGGQVFTKPGEVYAVYLPDATSTGTLDLSGVSGSFQLRWYNPRTSDFDGAASTLAGGGSVDLGAPPNSPSEDWVVLLENTGQGENPDPKQSVTGFTLINAETNQPIMPLTDGTHLNLAKLPTRNLNVRAETSPVTVGSVRFVLNDSRRTENTAPYALARDLNGDYVSWTPNVGSHTLTGTPYSMSRAGGTEGKPLTVTLTVTDE